MPTSNHLDAHWEPSKERGFLPKLDPLQPTQLPGQYLDLEMIATELPFLLNRKLVRERVKTLDILPIDSGLTGQQYDRLMMLYSYLASAYVHARGEETVKIISKQIAVPLCQLASILDRKPIVSYWAYCLNNWKKKESKGPLSFDNLTLLQNFEDTAGDEDGFILIHTDIEGRGGAKVVKGLERCGFAQEPFAESASIAMEGLEHVADGLNRMNRTMARMPDACSKERYADIVRPYIFSFDTVVYEGVPEFDEKPQTLRGETGAQSSIVPAIDEALGIKHKKTMLTEHLSDMRGYMPHRHRMFLNRMHTVGQHIRPIVKKGPQYLRQMYNDCIKALLAFNETHYKYAMEYVKAKVPGNPSGTGGTPYEKWLWQLHEERKEHLL